MLWQKFKPEGIQRIMDLVARCPELQGKAPLRFPHAVGCGPNWLPERPRRCRRTTNHTPADLLTRAFLRKRLLSIQGKKHSARSRNPPSQSATPYMKMVQITPQPELLEGKFSLPLGPPLVSISFLHCDSVGSEHSMTQVFRLCSLLSDRVSAKQYLFSLATGRFHCLLNLYTLPFSHSKHTSYVHIGYLNSCLPITRASASY
ncbi:hypothetical protein SETIT_5G085800v2 [Setaria italica]|uniref:Uncharacterized protein n=1 Tax=Setaria italica TaxID=4555 RepID=A0A368R2N3_SETIT|nr:uncharacterized protein LOC101767209 isoform X1 [Setaria italica]RCV24455.1 hypothetical protein SETIT_5G085800v2 [Setaria italica]